MAVREHDEANRFRHQLLLGLTLPMVALSGCTGCFTDEMKLAEIDGLELHADLVSDSVPVPRVMQFRVELYHPNIWETACPVLPAETKVTIDGVTMPEEGGDEGGIRGSQLCEGPHYQLFEQDFPPVSEVTRFVAFDGETSVTAEFANLFARRSVALVSPTDGILRHGEKATVEITPDTDSIEPGLGLEFVEGATLEDCRLEGAKYASVTMPIPTTADGNRLEFEVPAIEFTRGCVCASTVHPKILRCEGVGRCLMSIYNFKPGEEPCVAVTFEP